MRTARPWRGEPGIDKTGPENSNFTAPASAPQHPSAPMVSVYDGRRCIGFVLAAGREGFRAYDADEVTLGLFPKMRDAVAAVSAKAIGGGT
jgi:hypothetical protein